MNAGFYDVSNRALFEKRVSQAKANGYRWGCDFPGADQSFDKHCRNYHGNSKLVLHLYHNGLNGRDEMVTTTKSILKTYPQYQKTVIEIL